jgi:hypothetical protein
MRMPALPRLILLGGTAFVLAACPTPAPDDDAPSDLTPDPVDAVAEVYEARLGEVDASGVAGSATIELDGEALRVTVVATGLRPDSEVPQHIHLHAGCDSPGGILLNLDRSLTVANEGTARGEDYPRSDGIGALEYEATRSLEDLRAAAREHGSPVADDLDLGNRVVSLHAPDMRPVACGPLERRR